MKIADMDDFKILGRRPKPYKGPVISGLCPHLSSPEGRKRAQEIVVSDPECQVIVGAVDVVKTVCMAGRSFISTVQPFNHLFEWAVFRGNSIVVDGAGYMAHDSWIGNYYVGSDGAMVEGTTVKEYTEEELYNIICSACPDHLGEYDTRFAADFNNDGRKEMIVASSTSPGSEYDSWKLSYWYTDGEHTYSFGEDYIRGWIYDTKFSLIPTSEGNDLIINREWRPLTFGGYMENAYIYRLTSTGAVTMFGEECCQLNNPAYESVTMVKYEPLPGMTDVYATKRLYLAGNSYQ